MAPTPTKRKIVASTPNKYEIASVTPNKKTPNNDEIVSVSPKNKKALKQKELFGFMKKRAPPVLSIKDLHHGSVKYSRIRGWNDSGTVLSMPIEQQKELLKLSELRTDAINEKDWQGGEKIQHDMDHLKELIAGMNSNIEEAKGALKESLLAKSYYIAEGKLIVAGKWDNTALAAEAVLAQYFQYDSERKEESNTKTVELDAEEVDKQREEDSNEPGDDDLEEQQEAGPTAGLNPFDAPEKSHATRHRKEKASVATGVRAPKVRKLDKFMSRKDFDTIISKPWQRKTSLGATESGPNKNGHALTYVASNGQIFCEACSVYIPQKTITQHIIGTKHEKKLKTLGEHNSKRQKTLHHVKEKEGAIGSCLSNENKVYRIEMLQAALTANVSMGQYAMLGPTINLNNKPGLSLGNCTELVRAHGEDIRKMELNRIRSIIEQCHPEFATISDGTPTFAKAEAIKIRMVRRQDWKIMELLVSVKLFKSGLNGQNLAANFLNVLQSLPLDLKLWQFAVVDRAATNTKCINDVCEHADVEANPTRSPCNSHSLCKPGEALQAPDAERFRQKWNQAIVNGGKAADHFKVVFGMKPKTGGGIRWYVKWEQIMEIHSIGIERIMEEIVPISLQREWSKASMESLVEIGTKERLPKIAVEMAAVVDGGRVFCEATYSLEGDDPLILTAHIVIKRITNRIAELENGENIELVRVACRKAAADIILLKRPLLDFLKRAQTEVLMAQENCNSAYSQYNNSVAAYQTFRDGKYGLGDKRSNRTTKSQQNYSTSVTQEEKDLKNNIARAKEDWEKAKEHLQKCQKEEEVRVKDIDEWDQQRGGLRTEQEFLAHAKDVISPALTKYRKLYEEETGDHFDGKRAIEGCQLFDPFYLATCDVQAANLLVEKLKHFKRPDFTDEFLDNLKKEIPEAIKHSKTVFDWEDVAKSQQYARRFNNRQIRTRQRVAYAEVGHAENVNLVDRLPRGRETVYATWKDDPGERARRIWLWWIPRLLTEKFRFKHFACALKTIVINQISSASVERVFSQLNFIVRAMGTAMLEDTLEMRLMHRCNHGLDDDFGMVLDEE
jgi:hypothetical protein